MSYKKKAEANRDALFGGVADAKTSSRPGGGGGGATKKAPSSGGSSGSSGNTGFGSGDVSSRLEQYKKKKATSATNKKPGSSLSEEARQAKLQQAQEYRDKANKCMQKSFFSKPDPVAASTYYKRAADAYQVLGDLRLEGLYRLESANCNMQLGAWATAASDFTRAAELLVAQDEEDKESGTGSAASSNRRKEAAEYHRKASYAWTQMNEKSKAGKSQIQAAIALHDPEHDDSRLLSKEALTQMEEAVEAHVPDVLNIYARYRQTGKSAFLGDGETIEKPSPETIQFAQSHIVTQAYAHEPLQDLVYLLVSSFGEYASALYTAGAVSAILEADGGMSTLSLSRAYCTETVLALALGDPILAQEQFLQRHVQKTFYLSSRECKLSEDLFRAIQQRDADALEEARDVKGSNRAAMANLHSSLQTVISQLRTQGVARNKQGTSSSTTAAAAAPSSAKSKGSKKEKASPAAASSPPKNNGDDDDPRSLQELMGMKTGYEQEAEAGKNLNPDELAAELDDLDFDLDDNDGGNGDNDSDDDSDIDLR